MSHRPRKRFGQNFLQNDHVIDLIIQAINPQPDDHIIEIGPGLGALTKPLLMQLNALTAIEIDRDLQPCLLQLPQAEKKLNLITADVLRVDFSEFGKNLTIIGNLPYNISTPLIFHLLNYLPHIDDMYFMLQKEVVERLAASVGGKNYGRLSVMIQYFCEAELLFEVPPEVFYPKPKVNSAVVRLTPRQTPKYPAVERMVLERLVAQAFTMRRKTLANNLKSLVSRDELVAIGIDPGLRAEQISVLEYAKIAKLFSK